MLSNMYMDALLHRESSHQGVAVMILQRQLSNVAATTCQTVDGQQHRPSDCDAVTTDAVSCLTVKRNCQTTDGQRRRPTDSDVVATVAVCYLTD